MDFEEAHISSLLKKYFAESYEKFSDNAEYLFFIGKKLFKLLRLSQNIKNLVVAASDSKDNRPEGAH